MGYFQPLFPFFLIQFYKQISVKNPPSGPRIQTHNLSIASLLQITSKLRLLPIYYLVILIILCLSKL